MDIINYFGIYTDDLKRADRICKNALKKYGADDGEINGVFEYAYHLFYNNIREFYQDSLTNAIIYSMFYAVKCFIENDIDVNVDFFVNGSDSHMYIDGVNAEEYEFEKEND